VYHPGFDYNPIAGRSDSGWTGCMCSGFAAGILADFGLGLDFVAGSDIPGSGSGSLLVPKIFLYFLILGF